MMHTNMHEPADVEMRVIENDGKRMVVIDVIDDNRNRVMLYFTAERYHVIRQMGRLAYEAKSKFEP